MNKHYILFLLIICSNIFIFGQQNSSILRGKVVDDASEHGIPNVQVLDVELGTLTTSDENGYFTLKTENLDKIELQFFHTAFEKRTVIISKSESNNITVHLKPRIYEKEEVEIRAIKNSFIEEMTPGKLQLKQKDILGIPTLLGEPDVIRSLQLQPGIQSINEGTSGIYVRGGCNGQNFISFDNIELMNPSHLLGIYSVFNPFLVEKVDFYKGNAPIQYSSRIASSIIIETFNNKKDDNNWCANIGNISSNLSYQGKSKNNKWYMNTGFRRSYLDALEFFADQLVSDEYNYFSKNRFNFYDFNGKIRFTTVNSNLTFAWYKGGDYCKYLNNDNGIYLNNKWGNGGLSLTWRYIFNPDFSMMNSLSLSNYFSNLKLDLLEQDLNINNDYIHILHKSEFTLHKSNHILNFGCHTKYRVITPKDLDLDLTSSTEISYTKYQNLRVCLFASDQFPLTNKLKVRSGGSISYYTTLNNDSLSSSENENSNSDQSQILGNIVVSLNYATSKNSSIKASYSHCEQDIHQASIASLPLSSAVWMPATNNLPAEKGDQYTLGYFKNINKANIQLSLEGYYKSSNNELLLNVNYQNDEIENMEDNFSTGIARSYGAEFHLKNDGPRWSTNISYSLGWAQQKFATINNGEWHDAKYDRRHDLSIVEQYKLNNKFDFGLVFIYATGNKTTLPVGRYLIMGDMANVYDGINNFRMPSYHRLDLSINYHLTSNTFKESILNFSIINVYNHCNPYFIYLNVGSVYYNSYNLNVSAKQVSLFPLLPSFSWKFKF